MNNVFQKLPDVLRALVCLTVLVVSPDVALPNPGDDLQRAVQFMQQGNLRSAEEAVQLALRDPETQPGAYAMLGSIRLQQKRYQEGTELLERAIKANPDLVGAHLTLAQGYALLGKIDRAGTLFEHVLRLTPDNQTARLALVKIENGKGNHSRVRSLVRPLENTLKASPDGLLLLAETFAALKEPQSARSLVSNWLRLTGVPVAWTMKFALAISESGLTDEPVELLENLKGQGLASYEVAFNLGGLYLLQDDQLRALENYELALTFNDRSLPALLQVARIAEQQGELEKALSFLIRAKLEAPEAPEVLFRFGSVGLQLDFVADATEALEKAVRLRPKHKGVRYWLATAHGITRKYDKALEIYLELLEENPEDPQMHYAVGTMFYLQAAFEQAEKYLKKSMLLAPDELLPSYYIAMAAQKQGDAEKAVLLFGNILKRHPEHGPSHEGLGRSLFKLRRYEEARVHLEKSIGLDPESSAANYQLGQLLVRMGFRKEAKERLATAKELREAEEKTRLVRTLLNPH